MRRKLLFCFVLISFIANMVLPNAQVVAQDVINTVSNIGCVSALNLLSVSQPFVPLTIKGLKLYSDDPFKFDFMIDEGNSSYTDIQLKAASQKLINYFLVSLTIPEDELWVNLSPYEKDRIIAPELGSTGMGEDMLDQDYILKQLASSLTFPESAAGKKYWEAIQSVGGSRTTSTNNFQKVWIVPDQAVVYTDVDKVYVGEATLKVMVEEDYLVTAKTRKSKTENKETASTTAFKQCILPLLDKEVNNGKNFTQLRQMYKSLILAAWFKKHLKENIVNKLYSDKKKMKGVDTANPQIKEKIYNQYLELCKNGVYNYVKRNRVLNRITRRQYFSGGVELSVERKLMEINLAAFSGSVKTLVEEHLGVVHARVESATAGISFDSSHFLRQPLPVYSKIGADGRYKGLFVPRDWGAEVHIDYGLKDDELHRVLGHETFHVVMHALRLEDRDGLISGIDEKTEDRLAVLYEDAFLGNAIDIPKDLMSKVTLIEGALNRILKKNKQSLVESLFAYMQYAGAYDERRVENLEQRLDGLGIRVMFIGSAHEFMKTIKKRSDEGLIRAMASFSEEPVVSKFDINLLLAQIRALGITQAGMNQRGALKKRAIKIIIAAAQENPEDIMQHIFELFSCVGKTTLPGVIESILSKRPDLVLQYAPDWYSCTDEVSVISILRSAIRLRPGTALRLTDKWVPGYLKLRKKVDPDIEDILLVAVDRDYKSAGESRLVWRKYISEIYKPILETVEARHAADTAELDRVGGINFNRDKFKIEEKGKTIFVDKNRDMVLPDFKNFTGFAVKIIGIERKSR